MNSVRFAQSQVIGIKECTKNIEELLKLLNDGDNSFAIQDMNGVDYWFGLMADIANASKPEDLYPEALEVMGIK